ncbi:phage portal protein [Kurthia massiliensis]|uniref:phage portal protein n=1 Tax=Kurthia massiliensis TaxID=1033739 RepID=UPI00028A3CFB|nr:phage portal protein [Kurthia massiliensis]
MGFFKDTRDKFLGRKELDEFIEDEREKTAKTTAEIISEVRKNRRPILLQSREYKSDITREDVLGIPVAYSALKIISRTVSQLDIKLKDKDGNEVPNNNWVKALSYAPNRFATSDELIQKAVIDYLLYGDAFIYKKGKELSFIPSNQMKIYPISYDGVTIADARYVYEIPSKDQNAPSRTVSFNYNEILKISSGSRGIINDLEKSLRRAQAELDFSVALLKNAAMPTSVVTSDDDLNDDSLNELQNSFETIYRGPENAGKTIIWTGGLKIERLSMSPNELQLVDIKKDIIADICRILNMPQSLVDSDVTKYRNNIEARQFYIQSAIVPILSDFESAFNLSLLTDKERAKGYYFEFDTSSYLRMNDKEQSEIAVKLFDSNIISQDEARKIVGLQPDTNEKSTHVTPSENSENLEKEIDTNGE